MTLNKLIRFHDWVYLASMDSLQVFEDSGARVAVWDIAYGSEYGWEFICRVNTLPDLRFNEIVENWEAYVNEKQHAFTRGGA
jgi:hypothetical protein